MIDTITKIDVGLIDPSPFQTRIFNGSADLKELAASIKAQGVLQPILVRQTDGIRYELMAGERRLRASKKLKLETIPAIVRDVEDAEACAICVSENFQREDLHPLEEGEAVALLLEQYTLKEAAARLGRSQTFVARRAQVSKLSESWKAFIKEGHLPSWGVLHYEMIAKMPHATQDDLLGSIAGWDNNWDVATLERNLQRKTRRLDYAVWDLKDESYGSLPSCHLCPDRSAKNPMLFGKKKKGEPDFCLNGQCFSAKMEQFVGRAYTAACERYAQEVIKVTRVYNSEQGIYEHDLPHTPSEEYEVGMTPVFMLDGEHIGQVLFVKFPDVEAAAAKSTGSKKKSWGQKEEGLRRRRYKKALTDVFEAIQESESGPDKNETLALVGYMGVSFGHNNPGPRYSRYEDQPDDNMGDHIARFEDREAEHIHHIWTHGLIPLIKGRLKYESKSDIDLQWDEAVIFASLAGIDAQNIMDEAVAAIKEPKSWAKQRAQEGVA